MSVTNSTDINWMTPEQAGKLIPGAPSSVTVRKWAREGKLRGAIQLPSGRWRIPESAVDAILDGEVESV